MANYSHAQPNDERAERTVLSAIINEKGGLSTAVMLLHGNEAVFYQPIHQAVFRAAMTLYRSGRAIDELSLLAQLERDDKLRMLTELAQQQGDGQAIHWLANLAKLHAGHALETHCLRLLEVHTRREMLVIGENLLKLAGDPRQDTFELLQAGYAQLNKLQDGLQLRRPQSVGELYEAAMQNIATATQAPDGLTGVPSGLRALDKITGGFQNSDLIIIAARPGMGKTSLALSMSRFAAGAGYAGLFLTLEMGSSQLVTKLIASEAEYTASQLRRGLLPGGLAEVDSIRAKTHLLPTLPLMLDDTPALHIAEFRAKAAKLKADYNLKFIVSDYLQLMQGDTKGNREQEISSVSRGLKLLAKELNIPVIALAQLSRATETRGGEKKPQLSDLRDSGAIEQDADMVIFPYRPEAYKITEDELGNSTLDTTELIIAKHRNGALESPIVRSVMKYGKYSDLEDVFEVPAPAGERPMYIKETKEVVNFGKLPASTFEEEMPF